MRYSFGDYKPVVNPPVGQRHKAWLPELCTYNVPVGTLERRCNCSKIMSPHNCNETSSPFKDGDDESRVKVVENAAGVLNVLEALEVDDPGDVVLGCKAGRQFQLMLSNPPSNAVGHTGVKPSWKSSPLCRRNSVALPASVSLTLSFRAERGTLVFARSANHGGSSKHQGPALRSG